MKKEEIMSLFKSYEDAVCAIDDTECWSARDLQKLLGYSLWQNFTNVINKAKEACENVGQPVMDHFIDVNKMIVAGKGAQHEVNDTMLTQLKTKEIVAQVVQQLQPAENKINTLMCMLEQHLDALQVVTDDDVSYHKDSHPTL